MDLEAYFLDVIRGKRRAPWLKIFAWGLSRAYQGLLLLRNKAYDLHLLPSHRLPCPVISVGNIVVGGTGKTPIVQLLTLKLQDKRRCAILTRGFRSNLEAQGQMGCISRGTGPLLSSKECGDEPYLLAQTCKASIWVGSSRVASAKAALAEGAECLILDDGMQHRKIARDIEIVVIDAQDPLSQNRFLPYGLLRDSPRRLKAADLIVLTHCYTQTDFTRAKSLLAPYTTAPCVGVRVAVLNSNVLPQGKVGVFCGLGTPERFLQTVRDLNREIVDTFLLKDHCAPNQQALKVFVEKCREKGAQAVVCTEKDAVKLPKAELCLKIIPIAMQLEFVAGEELFEAMVQKILRMKR